MDDEAVRRQAEALHRSAVMVEGHSDLMVDVMKRRAQGERAVISTRHVPRLRRGGVDVQVLTVGGDMACFNRVTGGGGQLKAALMEIDALHAEVAEAPDVLAVATSVAEIEAAVRAGRIALVMVLEGGTPLEGELGLLRMFYRLGVRSLQFTWNGRNLLGDGVGEQTNSGLSNFGKAVVREMTRLGMVIDVSHLSDACFFDLIGLTDAPIVASHSNARAVCAHPRNLTDAQIEARAKKGGVVGMNFLPAFVKAGRPTVEDLFPHIEHIARLVGPQHIGIGPDFIDYALDEMAIDLGVMAGGIDYGPSLAYPAGIEDVTGLPNVTLGLLKRRMPAPTIQGILGENFLRVFRAVMG